MFRVGGQNNKFSFLEIIILFSTFWEITVSGFVNQLMKKFWPKLAPPHLMVSIFHNGIHDHKGQENKIYKIVMGRETFYRRHTAPISSCSEVKYVYVISLL